MPVFAERDVGNRAVFGLEQFTVDVNAAACGDVALHVFAGAEGRVAVAWSASPRRLAPPRGVKAFDLMGNPMPRPELRPGEPVYLRAPPDFEAWARLF